MFDSINTEMDTGQQLMLFVSGVRFAKMTSVLVYKITHGVCLSNSIFALCC